MSTLAYLPNQFPPTDSLSLSAPWWRALLLLIALVILMPVANSQEAKIWEFSPYEVQVWYQFDASLPVAEHTLSRRKYELI